MRLGIRIVLISVVASLAVTLAVHRFGPRLAPAPDTEQMPSRATEATSTIDWEGSHGKQVLVLGRGFARDWFVHWGGTGLRPVGNGGVTLGFGDLEEPPKGRAAIRKHVQEAPKGSLVVYAPGPEDLRGGSAKAARDSVHRLLGEVDAVLEAAESRGLKVAAGGPLPSLPGDTDRFLVTAHRAYLDGLREREIDGLLSVFDAYDHMSTAGQVTLVRGYARVPGESRMGAAGFEALDEVFFPFVRERF